MAKTDFKFHHPVRVRWAECDPQGIAYNGAYLTWMEVVQAEYCRNLGFRLYRLSEINTFDTAMVKTTLEFKAPARLDDLLDLYARVARIGTNSITIEFEVYRSGEEDLLARMEGVYVNYDSRAQRSRAIPEDLRNLFAHFEATGQRLSGAQASTVAQALAEPERPNPETPSS